MSRLILIIICIFLVILITLFLIWPKYQSLEVLKREVERKEIEFRYFEEYFSNLERLSQKLKEYENQLSKIDFAFPSNTSLALLSLINFLQTASSQNGLVFEKFGSYFITLPKTKTKVPTLPETELSSEIKEIDFNFGVSGSYSALKNFLFTLEKSAKIIEVENLSFSFEEGEIFSFDLNIKTYSY